MLASYKKNNNEKKEFDIIEFKLNKSLEASFDQYSNGTTNDVQTPICDADKLVLK